MIHPELRAVTNDVIERSQKSRATYLARVNDAMLEGRQRGVLACGNLAHGFAACSADDKADLTGNKKDNIAIVSAYNDMLSAH